MNLRCLRIFSLPKISRLSRLPRLPRLSRISRLSPLATCLLLALLLTSCRYEVELYDDGKSDINMSFDWMTRFREYPDGMSVIMARDGDAFTYFDATNSVDAMRLRLESGEYKLTVMNRTFAEFGTMQFYQRGSHDGLYAQSNTWTQNQEQAWDEGRIYLDEPERIGVAVDTFLVPHTIDEYEFRPWRDMPQDNTVHLELPQVIQPMTTTLRIRCKVINIQYMRAVEGYIAGMADGFLLNQWWRRTQTGTIKLEHWQSSDRKWEYTGATRADDTSTDSIYTGWIHTEVETFGLPHGRELLRWRTPEANIIVLHFTLIDGTTINFSYPVGKLIQYAGDDGLTEHFDRSDVSLELDLELVAPFIAQEPTLPYSQPEGTGQFDAEVEPWSEEEDITISF